MTTHDSGAGPLGFFFWVQALLVLLYIGVPVLLVGAVVWWTTRRARLDMPPGLVRRARSARLAGLAAGLILGVLAIQLGQELLAPASVAIGYLFGLLTAELLWVPAPTGPLRVAAIQTRHVRCYIPRWSVPVLLSLTSRILVWCGISLAIAAVLVWCVMGWWKRLVVELPAAALAGPAAG
jgi:hypothetical protein